MLSASSLMCSGMPCRIVGSAPLVTVRWASCGSISIFACTTTVPRSYGPAIAGTTIDSQTAHPVRARQIGRARQLQWFTRARTNGDRADRTRGRARPLRRRRFAAERHRGEHAEQTWGRVAAIEPRRCSSSAVAKVSVTASNAPPAEVDERASSVGEKATLDGHSLPGHPVDRVRFGRRFDARAVARGQRGRRRRRAAAPRIDKRRTFATVEVQGQVVNGIWGLRRNSPSAVRCVRRRGACRSAAPRCRISGSPRRRRCGRVAGLRLAHIDLARQRFREKRGVDLDDPDRRLFRTAHRVVGADPELRVRARFKARRDRRIEPMPAAA